MTVTFWSNVNDNKNEMKWKDPGMKLGKKNVKLSRC